MTTVMQRQYDAIVAAAMAENPSAWISELRVGGGRRR
jgi:protein-L-isoaspartate O-methyltransferase